MTEISPGARRYTGALFTAGALLGLLVVAATLLAHPVGGHDAAVLAARYSARLSGVLFLLAFAAAPLARLARGSFTAALLRERRGLGLGFCAAHLVHLLAIAMVQSHGATLDSSAIGGALAYVFVVAMGATSNDRAVAWLGARRWKALHRSGIWFLWLIFALSYSGALGTPQARAWDWLMSVLLGAAMLARLAPVLTRVRARA